MRLPAFLAALGHAPPFRIQDLEYDVERLKNFYRRQGFFHTEIKPEISYGPGGAVDVTLKIDEGPWVKVTDIDVEVAGLIDLSELRSKWPLNPGDRFVEKPYDDLKNLYLNYLPDHGYPKVKVKGRVYLNEETNTAKILLSVNPGPVCYFGKVRIKDAEQLETPEAAVLSKLTFKTGQLFNQERLFDTQRKLYATDLFRSVILTPEQVSPQESTIPIVVELAEEKRSLKAGLGYGDEDKIRARLGLRYRNLWGGGRLLDLDARYSSLGYLFSESFSNPVVFGTSFDFVQQSGARRRNLPGFNDYAFFTQSRLERDIPWDLRVYFGHGLEFARPFDLPVETLILLEGTEPEKMYRASFALLGLRQDTTDSHIEPRRGGIMNLATESAPSFLRLRTPVPSVGVGLAALPRHRRLQIRSRGARPVGLIQPVQSTTQIPISRLFFSGGATSVRGYEVELPEPPQRQRRPRRRRSSPRIQPRRTLSPAHLDKIGGVIFHGCGQCLLPKYQLRPGAVKIFTRGSDCAISPPSGPSAWILRFPPTASITSRTAPTRSTFTVGYGF